jgi:hypothetical protein
VLIFFFVAMASHLNKTLDHSFPGQIQYSNRNFFYPPTQFNGPRPQFRVRPDQFLHCNTIGHWKVNCPFKGTKNMENQPQPQPSFCRAVNIRLWWDNLSANFKLIIVSGAILAKQRFLGKRIEC